MGFCDVGNPNKEVCDRRRQTDAKDSNDTLNQVRRKITLPNRCQNGPKSKPGESLGLLRGVSSPQGPCEAPVWQLLGGSWRILGASWVAPGPFWAPGWGVQGRLEGSLEASWVKFNAKTEPSW